jgi:hypothetical protein
MVGAIDQALELRCSAAASRRVDEDSDEDETPVEPGPNAAIATAVTAHPSAEYALAFVLVL